MVEFKGRDVLRANQFTREEVESVLEVARRMAEALRQREQLSHMEGLILATLFFEPSTRTRLSFETAMLRLGGRVISVAEPNSSSTAKGESLSDTIRTVEGYADVLVLRHPREGAAEEAAAAARIPVINAGDGAGQHPTQSLLDLYTIWEEKGQVDGLTVALCGDLKYGRTVHSLAQLLTQYDVQLLLVSPAALRMPAAITAALREKGRVVEETEDLRETLARADVLYMTRIQRERFEHPREYERLKGSYVLTHPMLSGAKKGIIVMHPLPRVDEISPDVDSYPGAAYFRQAANGIPVRMALLALIIGRTAQ